METPPPEVLAAARVVELWAAENNIKSWKIGASASRDELERTAARYAVAREIGTTVWGERWAGMRQHTATGAEFDAIVDRRIAASRLSLAEIIEAAKGAV